MPLGEPGVEVVTERAGDGLNYPKSGQTVIVHYVGRIRETNTLFDSSYVRGLPLRFKVDCGAVVKGWDDAVKQLSLGEKAQCIISPRLAYAEKGLPGLIPPNSTLVLDIELLSIV